MDKEGVGIVIILVSVLWFFWGCIGFSCLFELGSPLQSISVIIGLVGTFMGVYTGYKLL